MDDIILGFSDIQAGWMKMKIFDYQEEATREMRISYIQPFFNDLLMTCKFLLSDITGVYELPIDQEGFEATMKFYKYQDKQISVELTEDFFEDEVPYDGTKQDWETFHQKEIVPSILHYFSVDIEAFCTNIVFLIEVNKDEYNEGFALTPTEQVDIDLLNEVKVLLYAKKLLGGEVDEKASNT